MSTDGFPRALGARERAWLEWVLPLDRPGYAAFRSGLDGFQVIGPGRRGEGEIVLAAPGTTLDITPPLGAVFSYGAIETNFGTISVTIREPVDGQASLEIVSHRAERIPDEFEEARRWTYARWDPGMPCPQCGTQVREVAMRDGAGERLVLSICAGDRRLWVHEGTTLVNRLIPVTNFYNEIMLHQGIRDPKIALESRRLFTDLGAFSDADLARAFGTYNVLRAKVHVDGPIQAEQGPPRGLVATLKTFLTNKRP